MNGLIDVGGGLRGIYTAAIYDYLMEHDIHFDYAIGVSAGSANIVTYLAGQKGRSRRFYMEYADRQEYMSWHNFLRTGSYVGLDYIYSTLSNSDGEDPVDYEALAASKTEYYVVATDAWTGMPRYFTRHDVQQDRYDVVKASCALPVASKPYRVNGTPYFDGGVSDPVPYQKALADGCDKLVVLLTRPRDYVRSQVGTDPVVRHALRDYPKTLASLQQRHIRYNEAVAAVKKLEQQGKALLLGPADIEGMSTLSRNKMAMERLYGYGMLDAAKVVDFLKA